MSTLDNQSNKHPKYFTYLAILEAVEADVAAGEVQDPWHQVEQQQHLEGQQVLVDHQEVLGEELQHVTTSYQQTTWCKYKDKLFTSDILKVNHLQTRKETFT